MNGPGNMVSMNAAGGPVGGGPGINQPAARLQMDEGNKKRLNTYIYEYMLKNEKFDLARSFQKQFPIMIAGNQKPSPGKRELNGMDDMDTDSKDAIKRPADLPEPDIPPQADGSCFLYEWWCQFWDIFGARHGNTANATTVDYLTNVSQQRQRSVAQSRLLSQHDPSRVMQTYNNMMGLQQNGMMEMAKRAMTNRNPTSQQQIQIQQKLIQSQMQRDGSGMDMGGQRSQSPSMANAPSPSKRPRLDDGSGFNGQPMGPAGRGQPMSGPQMNNLSAPAGSNPPGQMMLQNGINPEMQQQQIHGFSAPVSMQPKQLEAMGVAGVPQPNQMAAQMEGSADYMNAQRLAGATNQTANHAGNHALQDYQMQLMLLEQQNKKRLLMARQEQDNVSNHPGQGGQPGPGYPMGATMSPSGSRAGPSPNPSDQMKRAVAGTPKMGGPGGPGSPMPDMAQNRGSPVPHFDHSQMPPNVNAQYYAQMGGNIMGRPPSSHPGQFSSMASMTPQQLMANGRLPNGASWPQGGPQQMIQQQGQAQQQQQQQQQPGPQQQMGTPQQRHNNMPPPPAPTSQEQPPRAQPSSPAQQNQAPPTPSHAPKANPKGKKEGGAAKQTKKNPPKKQATTGATPAAETAEPPTPTPSTPITPMHAKSFNNQGQNGGPQPAPANQQPPAQQPAPATQPAAGPPAADPAAMGMDTNGPNFGMFGEGTDEPSFDMGFSMNMDSTDVLDNFDFDSLLNTGEFNFGGMGDEVAPTAT